MRGDDCFGKCQLIQLRDIAIANLFGQKEFGTDKQYTDYGALRNAFIHLAKQMREHNLNSVAFPDMIGCGLAGGDRKVVLDMIREIFRTFKVEIWKF
jgi:O-acetyl-ADP-ribose deacetylase (regulator of RNase III)